MALDSPGLLRSLPRAHGAALTKLEMGLSPVVLNPIMIADASPHILSLLDHSLGPGTIGETRFEGGPRTKPDPEMASNGDERTILRFSYHHSTGTCSAALHLKACPNPPRPAWFSINGARVGADPRLRGEAHPAVDDPHPEGLRALVGGVAQGAGPAGQDPRRPAPPAARLRADLDQPRPDHGVQLRLRPLRRHGHPQHGDPLRRREAQGLAPGDGRARACAR
jgi:hypothetical protein